MMNEEPESYIVKQELGRYMTNEEPESYIVKQEPGQLYDGSGAEDL